MNDFLNSLATIDNNTDNLNNKRFDIVISESQSITTVLDLMTRRRECAWLKFGAEQSEQIDKSKFNIELRSKGNSDGSVYYLYIGGKSISRDITREDMFNNDATVQYALKNDAELAPFDSEIFLNNSVDGELIINLFAQNESAANCVFAGQTLQFATRKTKYYMDMLFLNIDVSIQKVSDKEEEKDTNTGAKLPVRTDVEIAGSYFDVKNLKVYGDLRKILFVPHAYEDDVNIEYRIFDGEKNVCYFLNEWHSNHLWKLDPAILSIYRVSAQKSPDECGKERVRFDKPVKYTEDINDKTGYFIEKIKAEYKTPDGIKIFIHEDEENPKEGVEIFEDIIKFKDWLGYRESEIYMA